MRKAGIPASNVLRVNVLNANVMSRITYAADAWRGFSSSPECNSRQIFLNKVKRWGITTEDTSIADVFDAVDSNLFKKSQYNLIVYNIYSLMSETARTV